jgi:hypothetical protein
LLDTYTVDENTQFKLSLTASGSAPYKYKFIYTADTSLFALDEATGELTSKVPFDFETPKSAAGNNQYVLSLLVIDSNNHSATKDINIQVQNVDEHEIVVDFPIDGANMGAAANKVHVRGHITESGKTLTKIPSALAVSVNGVPAAIDPATGSMWIAEVPLPAGENSISVQLINGGKLAQEKSITIANNPIATNRVTDGVHDYSIDIDLSGGKIYKRALSDKNTYSQIISNADDQFRSCETFSGVRISALGTRFAVLCRVVGSENYAIVGCNVDDKVCKIYGSTKMANNVFLRWADDQFLIYSKSTTEIGLIDTLSGSSKTLALEASLAIGWSTYVDVDNKQVVISLEKKSENAGYPGFYKFDLQPYIDSDLEIQNITSESLNGLNSRINDFILFNGVVYSIETTGFSGRDIASGSQSYKKVETLKSDTSLQPTLVHASNGIVVFLQDGSMFSYNLGTNETKILEAQKFVAGGVEIDLSPDSKRLALFNSSDRKFAFYDVTSGALSGYETVPRVSSVSVELFGSTAVDWEKNIIYRSQVVYWGGVEPDFSPIIVSYDANTKTTSTVLTASELAGQIGRTFQRLSARRLVYNVAAKELIFHVVIFPNAGTEQLICSFNLNTRKVKTLGLFPGEGLVGEIFMSRFNPAANGVAFAHWGYDDDKGGGVEWFNFDGNLTKLLEPQEPYYLTTRGVLNPAGDRYYGVGFKRLNGSSTINQNRGEVFHIDLTTKNRTVFASETIGLGLAPPWFEPVYDANRDVLIDFTWNHLWFFDTVTGDRVLKPIELPNN